MMTVNWTEAALADLSGVGAYTSRSSERYDRSFTERIFTRTDILSGQPRLGAGVPGYDGPLLRELLEDPNRIVHRIVNEDRIDVVAVTHAARRLPRGL